jgi:TP901 family phage tail tape measure protein
MAEAQQGAIRSFNLSGRAGLDQFATAFEETIRQVEDRWNSVFRAGTQIQSVGQGFVQFASNVKNAGMALTDNAGDFDFWIARTKAAMQSAGSNEAVTQIEELQSRTLDLGRELGSLDPEELATGWFTYQAALGETINTTEDLEETQNALRVMLQAGIISDSTPETVMRGVAGVLASYRLETEDSAYATSVLMNVTQRTQAEFIDLLEAYKMIGSQGPVMNGSIAETSALLAAMATQNIKGSQAGRSLNMVYSRLNDMTREGAEVLDEILVSSQGLQGSWEDIAFAGGPFIGLLGEIDEQGNVVKEGFIEKFVEPFMQLPKEIRDVELAQAIGKIFPENAARGFIPLVQSYADGLDAVRSGADGAQNELLTLYAEFQDGNEQARLFDAQWKTIFESLRQQIDRATYGFRQGFTRIGVLTAEVFIPVIGWVGGLVERLALFAENNPTVAKSVLAVVGTLAALAAVIGPLLIAVGLMLTGISGFSVAAASLAGLKGAFVGLLTTLGVTAPPLGILLGLLAAVALGAYLLTNNVSGLRDALGGLGGSLGTLLGGLGEFGIGLVEALEGALTGSEEKFQEGMRRAAEGGIAVLVLFPQRVGEVFAQFQQDFYVWGFNLMISLRDGIYAAGEYLLQAASDIAAGIAQYFESFSPPKVGPLRGIYVWGRNLIRTFIEGMSAADITAVSDIAGRIGDALQLTKDFGGGEEGLDVLGLSNEANELAAQMVGILQRGGRVSDTFFEGLRSGLGAWYEDIQNILFAYQDMYLAERALTAEQKKLDLLKKQREELEKQYGLREAAFSAELGNSNDFSLEANRDAMVDPTTEAGKAKIAQMRASLSTEDFQAWIAFQQQLWNAQKEADDRSLAVQEEAADAAVAALQQQLDLVRAQYEYYVKIYEYAKGLLSANKEEEKAGGGGGGGGAKKDVLGDPAALEEARRRVREIVGADGAIYDEAQLADNLGGDLPALGGADRQEETEQDRIDRLDAENRRRRAKYETDLINATSEEERDALKKQQDAWDAAYKEEKARLQERLGLTSDITEAADQQAELSSSERIQAARAEAEKVIREEMGGQLETAGDLKSEERELQDLRNIGDRKRLEFEKRLREAKGDEEATRRIKEEQQAWEEAYKAALQLQEERVEALRRVEQEKKEAAAEAAKASKGGGYGIPDRDDFPGYVPPTQRDPDTDDTDGLYGPPTAEQAGYRPPNEATKLLDDFNRALDFLGSTSVTSKEKVEELDRAVAEFFGWADTKGDFDWKKVLGLIELENAAIGLGGKLRGLWQSISEGIGGALLALDNFNVETWAMARTWAQGVWERLQSGWTEFVNNPAPTLWAAFWTALGLGWVASVVGPAPELWGTFWTAVQEGWTRLVATPAPELWATFWTALGLGWVANVVTPTPDLWTTFWTALGLGWVTNVITPTPELWSNFWPNLKKGWDEFVAKPGETLAKAFAPLVSAFDGLRTKIDGFVGWLKSLSFGGNKKEDGGRVGGSYKTGLASVPYDGFIAELHQAERVLTAEEAVRYNQLESAGLLGALPQIGAAVSAAVQGAQSLMGEVLARAANAGSSMYSNTTNSSRVTNLSIARVDANDPTAGRALLEKLAFHGQ